ncbi:MAG: glycosyltransferase [Candidatus Magnetominusculus sp. LBB02]|nr:glycosyltransferase [Candidatus Magnetominusculus sp. LBB02]
MRLAINAIYSGADTAALDVFTREAVRGLCRIAPDTLVFSPVAIAGVEEANIVLTSEAPAAPAVSYFSNLMFNNTILPYQLAWNKADVLFCPATEFPFIDILPMAVMIHDLNPLFYPERFGLEGEYFRTAVGHLRRQNVRALVQSDFLREQLLNNTTVLLSNIDLIATGLDTALYRPIPDDSGANSKEEFTARLGIACPYILCCVEPEDAETACNTVIAAFRDIQSRVEQTLLIVGRECEPSHKIQYLGGISDADMPLIFAHADMIIEPSNAGNVLKAMACGTPAIAANVGALPELATEAGTLFNPADAAMLSKAILMILENDTLRHNQIEKGIQYVSRFSWEKTVEDIYASCTAAYAASYDRKRKTNK